MFRPGEVIGVPAGVPDPSTSDIVLLRWLLVALALACAAALGRGRHVLAAAAAAAFAVCAIGFWVLALGRPYGLLVDPGLTRRAADLAVAAETGRADESFLAGEPRLVSPADRLVARLSRDTVLQAPTWLPVFILPLTALALSRLARGEDALVAALFWIVFSTGDLDIVRGVGFVPGLWARPGAAIAFTVALALLALVGRRLSSARMGLAAGLALSAAWIAFGRPGRGIDPIGTLLMLTLDQGVWLALGGWTLWRTRSGPAVASSWPAPCSPSRAEPA